MKSDEDRRLYDRNWYNSQDEAYKKRRYKQIAKRKAIAKEYVHSFKQSKGCENCGENDPVCLDFHHVTDDKEIDIGSTFNNGWSIKRIQKEIDKCIVLCSNCHRKHHANDFWED